MDATIPGRPTRRAARATGLLLALVLPAAAHAAATPYDGAWTVTLHCPPHAGAADDAKGYTHRFAGRVEAGELLATRGVEGEPGWHRLRGPIAADGTATLRFDGVVNSPAHAINEAPKGKPYSYRVKARFDANRGTGERIGGRACAFGFER